jgi:phage protein U
MGPTPLTLGPYAFQALGFHMSDLSRDLQTPWAEVDVCGRFDALHWTGPKSDTVSIKGCLFPQEFGGMGSLDGIKASARAGRPLMLVTGAGDVGGRFVVFGVTEDWSFIDDRGSPRRDAYTITLRRYTTPFAGGGFAGLSVSLFS